MTEYCALTTSHKNGIRPIAIGRKTFLFAGSHNGAQSPAMFYSFFACCKLNNINLQKWLGYVPEIIADHKANKLHEILLNNIDLVKIENFKRFWEVWLLGWIHLKNENRNYLERIKWKCVTTNQNEQF